MDEITRREAIAAIAGMVLAVTHEQEMFGMDRPQRNPPHHTTDGGPGYEGK